MGRMIGCWWASEARKKEAAEVEEEEAHVGAVEVEMAIEDMQKDNRAIRFSSKRTLQLTPGITLPNWVQVALAQSTKQSMPLEWNWLSRYCCA